MLTDDTARLFSGPVMTGRPMAQKRMTRMVKIDSAVTQLTLFLCGLQASMKCLMDVRNPIVKEMEIIAIDQLGLKESRHHWNRYGCTAVNATAEKMVIVAHASAR